jgi:two-component system, sensor histidine kinase and response regulator
MKHTQVLIVDDDSALLEALSESLQLRMGSVRVDTCDSSTAALERLAATDYDAIVADIKMPGMDGLELLAQIHQLRPETPTLLITGHGEHDLAVQALRGGAYDYVQKPIDRDYFVRSLSHAIERRRLSRRIAHRKQTLEKHTRELETCLEDRTRELRELFQREAMSRAELERAGAELQAARARREELVSMIAHDLATPLTTLRGYAQLLARPHVPSSERERATRIIISESARMTRLVQDLLDNREQGRPGGFSLHLTESDLVSIAREQIEIVAARSKRHVFALEAPEHLPATCDRERVAQIFANLLGNAIAYAPDSEIRICLWREGQNAHLSVSDDGPGIPRESLETIFEPGVRLQPTTNPYGPAESGLGLSIVREIVQAHMGRIWAESALGDGAVFRVVLPISERTAAQAGIRQRAARRDRRPVGSQTRGA